LEGLSQITIVSAKATSNNQLSKQVKRIVNSNACEGMGEFSIIKMYKLSLYIVENFRESLIPCDIWNVEKRTASYSTFVHLCSQNTSQTNNMRGFIFTLSLVLAIAAQAQGIKPVASFSMSESSICVSGCILVTDHSAGNIASWDWTFAGGNPSSSQINNPGKIFYNTPGEYMIYLKVVDEAGNESVDSASLLVGAITPAIITSLPTQGMVPLNVQISTTAPANECTWLVDGMTFNGMSALSHIYNVSGNFDICLVTRNASGCIDSSCADIFVWDPLSQDTSFLVVPNVFTPNNDLQNDIFKTVSQNISEWDTKVYNRWGSLVYSAKTPDVQWDGLFNGKPCEDGVYVYFLKATGSDGKTYDISGTLTLFR